MKDFPDQENVRTLLKQFKSDDDNLSPGVGINLENNSNSGSSTKKDDYVKKRVISMQEEMMKKYSDAKSEYDLGVGSSVPASELMKVLDILVNKLNEYENLLERYYSIEDTEEEVFDTYQKWKSEFESDVLKLRSSVGKLAEKDSKGKSSIPS